ncbi:hypothetical protein PTKIN_Ptkin14bG0118700 [Pterospermum kingtungense]
MVCGLVLDIVSLVQSFDVVEFCHVRRSANELAHNLAEIVCLVGGSVSWYYSLSPGVILASLTALLLLPTVGATLYVDITTDRLALLALKSQVTHDPGNLLENGWSTSTSVCNWIGVTCGSRHHRVTALNLSGMGLTGTIQPHLGNLSFLAWLDMSYNSFRGFLPIELANLRRLKYLNFGNNSFNGEIPSWFGSFTKLKRLSLYHNNFTGVIPSSLENLSKLEMLILSENDLKGQIPTAVGNLSSLKYLALNDNQLSDNLPSEIFDHLSQLWFLDLSENQFSGIFPTSLFKFKEIEYIILNHNQLEGTIALEVGNSTSLINFDIYNNFVGEVPSAIGNLTSLKFLTLISNNLTGRIPTPPPSLHVFRVAENNLVGEIPSSVCNLSSILCIDLFKNNLGGTIPECVGNLSSTLLHFSVQNNNFHGKLPENFAEGCSLKSFDINNNQLEGSLPRSLSNCKDLELLDVGNNNINDTFPNWLGNLDQLRVLVLRFNRFYGHIDRNSEVTVSLFSRLRVIDLSHNEFSGYLSTKFFKNLFAIREEYEKKVKPEYMIDVSPDRVYYSVTLSFTTKGLVTEFQLILTTWTVIAFSNNKFFGEIPEAVGELHSLLVLNLSHNSLSGRIPSSLGDLSELESLDLSSNKLEGRIPEQLKNLIFLEVLNLSHNYRTGPIPEGNQFDTFSNDSYSGNLRLCGFPLSTSCSNNGKLKPTPTEDQFIRGLKWKTAMLIDYGCGLVFGLSMGYIIFTTGKPWWFVRVVERVEKKYVKRENSK